MDTAPMVEGEGNSPAAAQKAKRWRRFCPRVSLQSLVLMVLLSASGAALWMRWDAWYVRAEIPGIYGGCFSGDGRYMGLLPVGESPRIVQTADLVQVSRFKEEDGTEVALSHDGKLAVSVVGSTNYETVVWDVETGKAISRAHVGPVRPRFTSDGRLVYDVLENRPVYEFQDAGTGAKVWYLGGPSGCMPADEEEEKRWAEHEARCSTLAAKVRTLDEFAGLVGEFATTPHVSGNGRWLVTHLRSIPAWQVWDLETGCRAGQTSYTCKTEHPWLNSTLISHDGARVAVYDEQWVQVWDVSSAQKVGEWQTSGSLMTWGIYSGLPGSGEYMVLSLVTDRGTSAKYRCEIWHVGTSKRVVELPGLAMLASPDGSRLVVDLEKETYIIETRTGRLIQRLTPRIVDVSYVQAFSPDGRLLLTTVLGSPAQLWRRRHSDEYWGRLLQAEFWLTVILVPALVWSLWRDLSLPGKKRPFLS
jgi:hypothetical protein